MKLIDRKELGEANNSLRESVEASSKAFDMALNKIQLEYDKFISISVQATIRIIPYGVGLFDRFDKDEIFKAYFTLSKSEEEAWRHI